MELLGQVILAFSVSFATIVLVYAISGRIMSPGKGGGGSFVAVIRTGGQCEELESEIRSIMWIMEDQGIYIPIIILAEDMTEEGQDLCLRLGEMCGGTVCGYDGLQDVLSRF